MAQPTYLDPELQGLEREKQLALALQQRGLKPAEGQMISGRYVAPAWTQNLANMFDIYSGGQRMAAAEQKQQDYANALRQRGAVEAQDIISALSGRPSQTVYGAGEEGPTKTVNPAIAANPQLALSRALSAQTPIGQSMLPSVMKQVMPEDYTLSEGQVRIKQMPDGSTQIVGKGGEKLHSVGDALVNSSGQVVYRGQSAGHVLETENGPMLVNTKTGQATPIMAGGAPVAGGKPLTESQSNATAFGIRAKESDKILKGLENQGIRTGGVIKGIGESVPFIGESLGRTFNVTASEGQQATSQARKNFVTAILRKESGASISPTEFANEEKKYFPQVGDSASTVLQKQKARETAIKALELQAGPGARQIQAHNPNLSEIAPAAVGNQPKVIDFNSLPK